MPEFFDYDHNESFDSFVEMMMGWANAVDGGDEAAARTMAVAMIGSIAQRMYDFTKECSMEVRAVLHAQGHTAEAVNVCRVWLTMMPDFFTMMGGPEPAEGEEFNSQMVIVGTKMHAKEPRGSEAEQHINDAVVAILRAAGAAATANPDGTITITGNIDHFQEHMDLEASSFAEEIEKELGDSTTDDPGERKWW